MNSNKNRSRAIRGGGGSTTPLLGKPGQLIGKIDAILDHNITTHFHTVENALGPSIFNPPVSHLELARLCLGEPMVPPLYLKARD